MTMLPFQAALGDALESADPLVEAHFLQSGGMKHYRGVMTSVWHSRGWRGCLVRPLLRIASMSNVLFAEVGHHVPFQLENTVVTHADGRVTMTWIRTFEFPHRTRRFPATMHYDAHRRVIVDLLSSGPRLEVELHAAMDGGAIVVESGRQWLWLGGRRLRIPRCLRGNARVREWQAGDDALGIAVTIRNTFLGPFFGYEGTFSAIATMNSDGEEP